MWIQGLPLADDEKIYELPCSDGTKMVTCDGDTYDHIQLIIANDNTARESAGHTAGWGQYTVVLTFENTLNIASNGCQSCNVWFENQNGDRITVKGNHIIILDEVKYDMILMRACRRNNPLGTQFKLHVLLASRDSRIYQHSV